MRIVAHSKLATTLGGIIALAAVQPAYAQMQTVDPDTAYQGTGGAIDGDLNGELPPVANDPYTATDPYAAPAATPTPAPTQTPAPTPTQQPAPVDPAYPAATGQVATPYPAEQAATQAATTPAAGDTYQEDDLIGAAEGVFGKGAEGLAGLIEKILKDQGEPNGYIVGREAGGAFIAGLRYGSGTLHHKIEGEQPIYWTGPSVGFDFGANAASTFVLVYNLWDTEQLYERYPAGEGAAYVVGGLNASYLRKGDVVLIPIRLGAGARLGVNAGYMKFSHKQKWMPF
ncbi:DUF1134 domain-containing protein [Croceicoccus mobilis]|nr:DUF1134 domain-containing protein [Croceicoccus mobilis]